MDFTAFKVYMLCDDSMRYYGTEEDKLGYEVDLTFPTYRGSFLCNVEKLRIWVDGVEEDQSKLRIICNDHLYLMEEVPAAYKEYWFTGDKAVLRVLTGDTPMAPGKHEVKIEMTYKVPYTGYFGQYMVNTRDVTKTLELR